MKTIAVVGATGYLGTYVCQTLEEHGYQVRYLVRSNKKLLKRGINEQAIRQVDVTEPSSLKSHLQGIDCVISCLGITRQKDGMSYLDIDFQANANVLDEAISAGVRKFVYVSVFKGEQFKHVALCNAKEKFVDYLKSSTVSEYCIVRPTGFFSDMKDFWDMAKSGRVYLFGSGSLKLNPIHGKDLADVIVNEINGKAHERPIGGPDIYTHDVLAHKAFDSLSKKRRITHVPDMFRKLLLWLGKRCLPESSFGPIEFFLTLLATDMVAPKYGKRSLTSYFGKLSAHPDYSSPDKIEVTP